MKLTQSNDSLPKLSKSEMGKWGESKAAQELEAMGYTILKKNWRTPFGEVDLVVFKDDCLEILEIKTRTHEHTDAPFLRALGFRQRARLARAGLWIWQSERAQFKRFKFRLLLVTQSGIKFCNLPLLYDRS